MARVIEFSDGAERGDTSWWTVGGSATTTNAIHGTYCYTISGNTSNQKTLTTGMSEFYFREWFRFPSATASYNMAFRNSTTSLLILTLNQALSRLDITGATTGSTGNNSIVTNTWQCFELHYKISDTVGVITIKIDGTQVFTFTGDTKPGTATTVDNFIQTTGSGGNAVYTDDYALDDADWCGLGYYVGLTAGGAGDSTQWTATGGANYANVALPASDTSYNTAEDGSALTDNYAMTTASFGTGSVLRIIPWGRVQNESVGSVNMGLKTNGTNYTASVSTPASLTWKSGSEYTLNPNTSLPWSQSDLDAIQFTVSAS